MNWRTWVKEQLDDADPLTDIIPVENIRGAGSLTGVPDTKPFIVIMIGPEIPALEGGDESAATAREGTVWVHDDPGSYDRIDEVLPLIRAALVGQVSEAGAIGCLWQGDSGELADDMLRTITRNASFRLVGEAS